MGLVFAAAVIALLGAAPAGAKVNARDPRVAEIRRILQRPDDDFPEEDRGSSQLGIAFVDLNGDGRDEAIVFGPWDRFHCGTSGCSVGVYERRGRRWKLKCSTTIGKPPIGVLATRHYGWRDITVFVSGGGILPGYAAVLSYNGSRYPLNPSVSPAREVRPKERPRILISYPDDFVPLFPAGRR